MSEPFRADVRLSLDRSRARRRVLLMVASLREAHVGQLSRMTGLSHRRVRAVLLGAPPAFSEERSLVALGLVSRGVRLGAPFEITQKGARHARRITSRWTRLSRKRFEMQDG